MRLYLLIGLFLSTAYASDLSATKRGLADAFDPLQGPTQAQPQETHLEHTTERQTAAAHSSSLTATLILPGVLTSLDSSTKAKETSAASRSQSLSGTPTPTSTSAVSNTQTVPSSSLATPVPATTNVSPTPAPVSSPTKPSSGQPISRGSQEWKIIGVAVIAFSTVAAILLLSVFFDQWWGFIRDLVWKKSRKDRYEEFIPDWEKASWEIKTDGEHHRYPTMPSPTKNKEFEREQDLDMEKGYNDAFNAEYMTGVGSGFSGKNQIYAPQPTYNAINGLGILTPIPQAHYSDHTPTRSASLHRSRSQRRASVAMTDPYGGIE